MPSSSGENSNRRTTSVRNGFNKMMTGNPTAAMVYVMAKVALNAASCSTT